MRIISSALIFLITAALLIACDGKTLPIASVAQVAPTASLPSGRWNIYFVNGPECPALEDGWKIVKLYITLENKTTNYSIPKVKATEARVFTDINHSYSLTAFKTTGSLSTPTEEIAFETKLPPEYRVLGEYQKDSIVSYYFQARIPLTATIKLIRLPGYVNDILPVNPGTINYPVTNGSDAPVKTNSPITVPGKVQLTVGEFTITQTWPSVNDLMSAPVTLINLEDGEDTTINLQFAPIGDNGIIGALFANGIDCKNKFVVGPSRLMTGTICAIIPHGTKNLRMVFLGEINAVSEVKEKK